MSGGFDALGARYFDGDRPLGQEVSLDLTESTLQIGLDDGERVLWPVAEVRRLADMAGRRGVMLRWTGDTLARLYLEEESLLAHLPSLNRRSPPRGRGRLMAWALAAVAAVALQIGLLVPLLADNLAGFIPPEGERALGEATLGHIRTALDESGMAPLPICAARPGVEALERMTARLSEPDQPEVTVLVLDHEMINAFALPGGFVVLFRGLIEAAEARPGGRRSGPRDRPRGEPRCHPPCPALGRLHRRAGADLRGLRGRGGGAFPDGAAYRGAV
jgi:hypothetical protein